jgi:hypothetical protein
MQPIGFFTTDVSEAAQAYEDHVVAKRRKPEGIEIAPAGANQGIGAGMRAVSALNRIDIPFLWRAILRAPAKKGGPVVSILAPRERPTADAATQLTSAGIGASNIVTTERTIECELPAATPATSVVQFAVAAVQAVSPGIEVREWQWTLRDRGRVPE